MSFLSPRLQLRVAQKQILTPGLVQMVTILQLNRLELQEMITQEIAENPVLEEAVADGSEELTPEEVQAVLESERDIADPIAADQGILEGISEDVRQAAMVMMPGAMPVRPLAHLELQGADPRPGDAVDGQFAIGGQQRPERRAQALHRDAQVDERPEHHVA